MARSDYTHRMVNGERVDLTKAEIDALVERDKEYDAAAPDRKWEDIRTRRDALLAETDHYALQDRELSEEMANYREQLRQVPQNTADPLKFDMESGWPTKP